MNLKALAFTLAVAAPVASIAEDYPFEDAIQARKAQMQLLAFNMGILGDMAKGRTDYDAKLAGDAAANLAELSQLKSAELMWPKGSDNSNPELKGKTSAKPDAWTKWAEVEEIATKWKASADTLAAAAGNGLGELRANIGGVGKGCKGCHDISQDD